MYRQQRLLPIDIEGLYMKNTVFLLILAVLVYSVYYENGISTLASPASSQTSTSSQSSDRALQSAYSNRQSNLQVRGQGVVSRILPDDLEGSRHQRFILQLSTGQTLLIAHNIDLAPRIAGLNTGDTVMFYGEYEWNTKGGVIHWTHHDPDNRHVGGWLQHSGRTYQ